MASAASSGAYVGVGLACPVSMFIDTLKHSPAPQARLTASAATLLQRIQHEYREMPGLKLTEAQATRLWGTDATTCRTVLAALLERGILRRTAAGAYVRASE
jgi:hypothetical protein